MLLMESNKLNIVDEKHAHCRGSLMSLAQIEIPFDGFRSTICRTVNTHLSQSGIVETSVSHNRRIGIDYCNIQQRILGTRLIYEIRSELHEKRIALIERRIAGNREIQAIIWGHRHHEM